jgi:precorrin-2 dehydrogenase/sirohydrochlorin ferrochelatase
MPVDGAFLGCIIIMTLMKTYPIYLIGMERRRVVVVGGGGVAARKVGGLLEADARVTVISPILTPELETLAEARRIAVIGRPYRQGDLAGAFLVIAAANDPDVNQAVWQEAEQRGCLVNVVDDPAHCNCITPAIVRRGDVTLAISTGGASPALARRLREQLEAQVGPEYGELARLLAELRPELRARYGEEKARQEAAFRLVDSDLLSIIKKKGMDEARLRAWELLIGDTE